MHIELVDAAVALHRNVYKIRATLGVTQAEAITRIEDGDVPCLPPAILDECRTHLAALRAAWPKLDSVECLVVAATVVQAASRSFSFVIGRLRDREEAQKNIDATARRYEAQFIEPREVSRKFVVCHTLRWIAQLDGVIDFNPEELDITADTLTERDAIALRNKLLADSAGIALWMRDYASSAARRAAAADPEPVPVQTEPPPAPQEPPSAAPVVEEPLMQPMAGEPQSGPSGYVKAGRRNPSMDRSVEINVNGTPTVVGTAGELRQLRVEAGLSQNDVARALGIGQPHISNVESGRDYVSVELATRWWRLVAGYQIRLCAEGVRAHAIVRARTVTIQPGSEVSANDHNLDRALRKARKSLREDGVLAPVTVNRLRVLQPIQCRSETIAARLVTGNGAATHASWVEVSE